VLVVLVDMMGRMQTQVKKFNPMMHRQLKAAM